MTGATASLSPGAAAAAAPEVVTDAKGRRLTLRVLETDDTLNLLEAAGEASGNAGYMRYAQVICSVAKIDDVSMPRINTKPLLLSTAKLVGNAGLVAVARALFPPAPLVLPADAIAALRTAADAMEAAQSDAAPGLRQLVERAVAQDDAAAATTAFAAASAQATAAKN